MSFFINNKSLNSIGYNGQEVKSVYYNNKLVWSIDGMIDGLNAIKFSSTKPFTVKIGGTWQYIKDKYLQYNRYHPSVHSPSWNGWRGEEIEAQQEDPWEEKGKYVLYIRGKGHTCINTSFTFNGTNIYCEGNIMSLLDHENVRNVQMGENCFNSLFGNCVELLTAPILPATTLTKGCYEEMFGNCYKLKTAPVLPATILPDNCYSGMFINCENLRQIPLIPQAEFYKQSCKWMFGGCSSIKFSATQTAQCPNPYPIFGTNHYNVETSSVQYPLYEMLSASTNTDKDIWTPTLNTTYYTNATIIS